MKGRLKDITFGFGGEQNITITVAADFRQQYDELKDSDIRIDISKWREKRSLDANAYFHVLVNKIAQRLNLSDSEVKRNLVLDYGALARDSDGGIIGAMLPESADIRIFYPYAKAYKEIEQNGKTYVCYMFYKRTRTLDTKEMSRLIDGTVNEAKSLGIETETPEKLARIKEEWEC